MSKMSDARVAYLECRTEQGWEDYSIAGLVEHLASLFGVKESEFEHELALYDVEGLAEMARAGDMTMDEAREQVQS